MIKYNPGGHGKDENKSTDDKEGLTFKELFVSAYIRERHMLGLEAKRAKR